MGLFQILGGSSTLGLADDLGVTNRCLLHPEQRQSIVRHCGLSAPMPAAIAATGPRPQLAGQLEPRDER